MEDNIELIETLAGGISADPALQAVDWDEVSIVFSFEEDGFCSGHFGYAYTTDGTSTPFTLDGWEVEKDAEGYREWLKSHNGDGAVQILLQFNRTSGGYHSDFAYDRPRWQVTPSNLDEIVPALRPGLA